MKNIIIVVIEIIAILTRNARRTLKSHRENNLDATQSQKTEKNQIELLDNNASSSNEFENKNTTIIQSVVMQKLQRNDARVACEKKKNLEILSFLLLIKIEEL